MSPTHVFQCPNCQEFINSSMVNCKYCDFELDPQSKLIMATIQDKVDKACNHAGLTRSTAATMLFSFFMRYVPIIGLIFVVLFIIAFFATPVQLLIWQFKYSGIETADPDYKVAKKNVSFALITWLSLLLISFLLIVLSLIAR